MGFIAAVLLPVFSPPGTFLVAGLFAVPFLVSFTIDWLVVSGIHKWNTLPNVASEKNTAPDHKLRKFWRASLRGLITNWLPLTSRVAVVALLAIWLLDNIPGLIDQWGGWSSELVSQAAVPGVWVGLMLFLTSVGLIFLVFGAAGRLAALFVLIGMGIFQSYAGLGLLEILMLVGASILMYLGTGPYSVWVPEERIIARRIGEP
jgi:hypothetical protein